MNGNDNSPMDAQREKGRGRAMRLMEALSGTDEELLARSEQAAGKARPRPLWYHMRTVAALLCLAVVGAVSWGGYQLSQMKMGGSDSGGAVSPVRIEEEAAAGEAAPPEEPWEGADSLSAEQKAMDSESPGEAGGADMNGADHTIQNEPRKETSSQDQANRVTQQASAEADKEALEEKRDGTDVTDKACPIDQSQKLTESQARSDKDLGGYVPTALPQGYAFESASRTTDQEEANLNLCWCRGMDSIMLFLSRPAQLPDTVDVTRTEIYDERLYEIPYGETVPREYWEIFQDPVFAAEDLTLEIIKSRMKSYDDKGDTDTPRGNFRVLYPDGTVARFSGRGTAEEIWDMFCSIGQ